MLGIVIVNYRTNDLTINYVKNELKKIIAFNKIVIVDIAYNNILDSYELAEQCGGLLIESYEADLCSDNSIYVLPHEDNLGYAKGNNYGAAFLKKNFNIDFYLFTNNDIKFLEDEVVDKLLVQIIALPDVGAIGPRILGVEGEDQNPRKYISIWKKHIIPSFFWWYRLLASEAKCFTNIEPGDSGFYYWVSGAFLIVRADAFHLAGMFDNNTFLYSEEPILAERMRLKGFKFYYLSTTEVLHEHSKTTKTFFKWKTLVYTSFNSDIYYYRNYKNTCYLTIVLARIAKYWHICICYSAGKIIRKWLNI